MGAVSTDPPPNLAKGHTCFCTLHPCSNNPSVCVNHPPPSPPVWDGTNRKSGSQKEAHSSTQKTTCKQRRPPNDVVGELQWVCLCLLEHKHAAPSCLIVLHIREKIHELFEKPNGWTQYWRIWCHYETWELVYYSAWVWKGWWSRCCACFLSFLSTYEYRKSQTGLCWKNKDVSSLGLLRKGLLPMMSCFLWSNWPSIVFSLFCFSD